jgi:hypothetical protein
MGFDANFRVMPEHFTGLSTSPSAGDRSRPLGHGIARIYPTLNQAGDHGHSAKQ